MGSIHIIKPTIVIILGIFNYDHENNLAIYTKFTESITIFVHFVSYRMLKLCERKVLKGQETQNSGVANCTGYFVNIILYVHV